MRTFLECYPCFMKQALDTARHQRLSEEDTRQILVDVGESLREIRLDMTPPEIAGTIYRTIAKHTNTLDPYRSEKERFTKMAKEVYPGLSDRVRAASDPLLIATVVAIIGNIIDLGVLSEAQVRSHLDALLAEELNAARRESVTLFSYDDLRDALLAATSVLYVGDNAGETVFDKILIEAILAARPEITVTYAVRDKPVINDAVLGDAEDAGLGEVATLISSGSVLPGTVLSQTSAAFQTTFQDADVILSKGQGNYESLSETDHEVFFLLVAKCPVIARDIGCDVGDIILLHHRGRTAETSHGMTVAQARLEP